MIFQRALLARVMTLQLCAGGWNTSCVQLKLGLDKYFSNNITREIIEAQMNS